ncbi:MAG: hypothetical protein QM765_35550 [Myxococcales bacterium]
MKNTLLFSALLLVVGGSCLSAVDTATPVGATGGEVRGPGQSRVAIPAGALSKSLAIRATSASPSLPVELQPVGGAVLLEPEGTTFAKPVTVTLPIANVPAGATVQIATAPAGSAQFTLLPSTVANGTVSAQTSHFSVFAAVVVLDLSVFDDFCRAYFQALGERGAACQGGTAEIWNTFSYRDLWCRQTAAALEGGRATFDPSQASACIAAIRSASCQAAIFEGSVPVGLCPSLFAGTVLLGQPCYEPIDCHPWGRCDAMVDKCPGVCVELLAVGDECDYVTDCFPRGICDGGRCRAFSKEGEACQDQFWCETGLFCLSGKCAKKRSSGPCPTLYECAADTYCDDGTCVRPQPVGDRCRTNADCGTMVPCIDGLCSPWSHVGEPCDDSYPTRRNCIDGWCDSYKEGPGTCQPWAKIGETCSQTKQCCEAGLGQDGQTQKCVQGICVAP